MEMVMAEWVLKAKGFLCDGRIGGETASDGDGDGRIGHKCGGDGKMGGEKTVTVVASEQKKEKFGSEETRFANRGKKINLW